MQLLDPELARSAPKAGPLQKPPINVPASVSDLLQLTFAEISERFASFEGFSDWLDARKRVAEIDRLEIQNAERQGELVSREAVRTHIVGAFHASHDRLLRDVPTALSALLPSMVLSGGSPQEIQKLIREQITRTLKPALDGAAKSLRKLAKATHEKDSDASPSP